MYNINFGKNKELMQKCQFLQEYAIFISVVRGFRDMGYTYERTLEEAVKKCIEENVLREFLIHNKAGVLNMILSEYDEKLHIENEKRIALEKAHAEWELHVESEKRIAVEEAQAQWRLHAQEQIQLAVNEAHTQWQLHTQEQIQLAVDKALEAEHLKTEKEQQRAREAEELLAQTADALQRAQAEIEMLKKKLNE